MLKQHKALVALTTAVTALPMLIGLLIWDKLPDQVPTHFNFQGVADGWSSKPFAVFALPGIVVACHLLCALATMADPRKQNIQKVNLTLVLWLCPIISLFTSGGTYMAALGLEFNMSKIIFLLCGVMFLVVGNHLPKLRQNYTIGIKLPWTLADVEVWDKTHRLAGPLWMLGGVITLLAPFLGDVGLWLFIGVITLLTIFPCVYSFLLYRKKHRDEG